MKIFIVLVVLFVALFSQTRDNPFVSTSNSGVINTKTSNRVYLDSESIDIPDSARKINKITIEYINSDGSISVREPIEMNLVFIDPDKPLIFSQKAPSLYQDNQKQITKKVAKESKKIKINSLVSYKMEDKTFIIYTKDKLLRDFALPKPYKIVLDFKNSDFKYSISKSLKGRFKQISFGSHRDFYRVVIELDRMYKYKLKKMENGLRVMIE